MERKTLDWTVAILVLICMCMVGIALFSPQRSVDAQALAWPNPPYPPTNISCATGTCTVLAAPSSFSNCIYGLTIVNGGASAVTVNVYQDGGTTSVASAFLNASGGSANWQLLNGNPKNFYFITNNQTAFVIKQSGTVQLNGSVYASQCP